MRERAAWYWDKRGVRGDGKESELGLASGLLAELDLTGKVVTGDALYAQRGLSLRVLEQGGDYFWTLKDNQPGVKEAVSLLFKTGPSIWAKWTGVLRGTDQVAQGQGDGGAGLRHHQPACGAGGRSPAAFDMAWALGNRKPAALGEGRGFWRGPKPGANWVGAATAGRAAAVIGMLRLSGAKNIAAALRHYSWKPWEALTLIGLLPNN